MASRRAKAPGRPGRVAPWLWIGLGMFVLADVLLVWAAMTAARTPPPPSTAGSFVVSPVPEPTPAETAAPAPAADLTVAPPTVLLAAYDETTAYRTVTGTCPAAPADLEVTNDGGVTWSPVSVTDASAIAAIAPEGANTLSVVAYDAEECAPGVYRSFVQGAGWTTADELDSRWRVGDASVIGPGGASVAAPCPAPVQVAALTATPTSAAVLCADAVVHATTDGGATWVSSEPISGAAAVAAGPSGYLVAVERQGECAGAQVAALDAASLAPGELGGCVTTDAAAEATTALSVSNDGAAVWLWSNGIVSRSFDGGVTW